MVKFFELLPAISHFQFTGSPLIQATISSIKVITLSAKKYSSQIPNHDRAEKLCSADNLEGEIKMIESILKQNGYRRHFIQNSSIQINNQCEGNVRFRYVSTPYTTCTSDRVGNILKDHNIILSNKHSNAI